MTIDQRVVWNCAECVEPDESIGITDLLDVTVMIRSAVESAAKDVTASAVMAMKPHPFV
jgi:hypothetical protein